MVKSVTSITVSGCPQVLQMGNIVGKCIFPSKFSWQHWKWSWLTFFQAFLSPSGSRCNLWTKHFHANKFYQYLNVSCKRECGKTLGVAALMFKCWWFFEITLCKQHVVVAHEIENYMTIFKETRFALKFLMFDVEIIPRIVTCLKIVKWFFTDTRFQYDLVVIWILVTLSTNILIKHMHI